ncbi:MAG: hypothetical protein NVS3B20_13160 [Polyangiales bacterium]
MTHPSRIQRFHHLTRHLTHNLPTHPLRHRTWIIGFAIFAMITVAFARAAFAASGNHAAALDESTDWISRLFLGGGVFAFVAAYLAGIAACATPCVYPMIGITVAVFGAKQAKSRREAALLSTLFVFGIAALYVPVAVIVVRSHAVWGRALSSPWVAGGLGLLFLAMSASMFGAFELSLPSSIQNRIANVGGVGPKGAFLMGFVSGLIASPCTTAPFGLILGSFAGKGTVFGSMGVLLFSIGLGTPFFLVGTFAAQLPKPGIWMQHIKSVFGVIIAGLALFYAKNAIPILRSVARPGTNFLLFALGAMVLGLLLGAIHLSFDDASWGRRVRKGFGVLLMVGGGFALASWLQLAPPNAVASGPADAVAMGTPQPVVWLVDEQDARSRATREGKPMIIDFTALWCAACHEMEKTTFIDPRFRKAAERFVALRLDGTDEDAPAFSANSKQYEVVGLPAVVILDSKGKLATVFRKKVEAEDLVAALERVN